MANSYTTLSYNLIPKLDDGIPYLKVEVTLDGDIDKGIVVNLPSKWAGVDYSRQVKNLKLNYPQGKIKTIGHRVDIHVPKISRLSFSYEIYPKPGDPINVYDVVIRKDLIHGPGYGIFAVPQDLYKSDKVKCNIVWQDLPNSWQTLSSYSNKNFISFSGDGSTLLHAVYSAGKVRIYQIADPKSPVYLSLYGNFALPDNEIIADLRGIILAQRAFFQDYKFPYYAISLLEGNNKNLSGGTGLYNSFAMYFAKEMARSEYYILFAHEHFHNWTGLKIRNEGDKSPLNYWWSEGFTDYYARVLAMRSNGISLDEFVKQCNQLLRDYYLSPMLTQPNARIKQDFWRNKRVEELPYRRGFVFAIYLNYLIKKNNPEYSLDNVMLDLFRESVRQPFSSLHFQEIVKKYIPQGISHEMQRFIEEGNPIWLLGLDQYLPLEKVKLGNYELGFDREALAQEKIIKHLKKDSNAYLAGLRNGDKVVGCDVPGGMDPDKIVTIQTAGKEIKFKPESLSKKDGYQFKSNLSEQDRLKIKKFFSPV